MVARDLGHFDSLLGHRAIQNPQGVHHAVHQLRHRKIENQHERADGAEIFNDVPHQTHLPASNLKQRCWPAPAGLFLKAEELRLGCGRLPDLRCVVLLVPPHPAPGRLLSPWGGVVLKRGQEHCDGLLFVSEPRTQPPLSASPSDDTCRWSPARISHHRLPKTKQEQHQPV